jgi:hypothetical protein
VIEITTNIWETSHADLTEEVDLTNVCERSRAQSSSQIPVW